MEFSRKINCEYCDTTQALTDIWLCKKCGAPLRPPEKVNIFARALSIFDMAVATDWSEGIDVSKWQGNMDWSVAKPLIDYAIIKASENTWEDNKYAINVDRCNQLAIPHGVYHFCRPEYDWRPQAEYFADRVVGQLPAFADVERTGYLSRSTLERWIYNFVNCVQDKSGYPVGIYTRSIFWNTYVARNAWCNDLPLWVARYNSYISDPGVPLDWDNWALWQWAADSNGEGWKYGAESRSIDKNRFNGTTEEFFGWIGGAPFEPPVEPEDCTQFRVLVDTLNVREGPSTIYRKIGTLRKKRDSFFGRHRWIGRVGGNRAGQVLRTHLPWCEIFGQSVRYNMESYAIAQLLVYMNMSIAFASAIMNLYSCMVHSGMGECRRVVHGVAGTVSLCFSVYYLLSLLGYLDDSSIAPYLLQPGISALFFVLIWNNIVDRKFSTRKLPWQNNSQDL